MIPWLYGVILVLCGVAAVVLVVHLIRDRVVEDGMYLVLAVLQAALIGQLVVGCLLLARTDQEVSGVLFVSYLVGVACAPVIGAFWSLAERSRAGTAVLLLAVATVAALEVRLDSIWSGAGA